MSGGDPNRRRREGGGVYLCDFGLVWLEGRRRRLAVAKVVVLPLSRQWNWGRGVKERGGAAAAKEKEEVIEVF